MGGCCNLILKLFRMAFIILTLIIIFGIYIEDKETMIKSKADKIFQRNPFVCFIIVFTSIILYSFYKAFSYFRKFKNYYIRKDQVEEKIKSKINQDISVYSNILLKLSYLGRIIYTFLSIDVVFFFYNFIVQSLLIFPGLLYDMENTIFKPIFYILFILFIIFSSVILIIPTYEFLSFPYLLYNDPELHLKSFKVIDSYFEYNEKNYDNENIDDDINKSLMNWGIIFWACFILGFFDDFFSIFKDFIEFYFLIHNFIQYFTIFFSYFIFTSNIMIGNIYDILFDPSSFPSSSCDSNNNEFVNILSFIKIVNNENKFCGYDQIIVFICHKKFNLFNFIIFIYNLVSYFVGIIFYNKYSN